MQNKALNENLKSKLNTVQSPSYHIRSIILDIPASSLAHNDLTEFTALCEKYLGSDFSNLILTQGSEDPNDIDNLMNYYMIGNTGHTVMLGKQDIGSVVEFTGLKYNPIQDWDAFSELFFDVLNARIHSFTMSINVNANSQFGTAVESFYLDNFLNDKSSKLVKRKCSTASGNLSHQYEVSTSGNKVLIVTEKGKAFDLPETSLIEWTFRFNSTDANIPWVALVNPQKYLNLRYKSLEWLLADEL